MAIPKETVDRIYSSVKIEEVVSDYVSLKRRGANLWGLCPFPGHNEKTPSFTVNPARNICKCFGCGKGGNAINFVIEMEQCSYPEALRKLAKKYGIEIEEREMTAEEKQRHDDRESMFIANEWANKWYQEQLWNTDEGRAIGLSYFKERGLRDETIRRFQLGYSPEKAYLLPQAAHQQGLKEEYLTNNPETRIGTGICGRSQQSQKLYDRYHDRVIFPFLSISGKTVGFAGRIIKKNDNVGKYVNSPESVVYYKKNELFGLYQAKQSIVKQQKCYWVEGQMDCISMSQAGIENVVCTGGTSLTKEQIQLIHRFTENVTILYDGDAAGIHAAIKGIDMFLEEGLNIKVMLFPDGDDPDSFARKHTAEEFRQYIADHEEDFIRYKTRTLLAGANNDLRLRSEAMHSIIASIALLSDRITRDLYIKDCAREFGMKEETLLMQLNQELKKRRTQYQQDQTRIERRQSQSTEPPIIGVDDEPLAPEVVTAPQEQISIVDENMRNLLRALIKYGQAIMTFQNPDGSIYSIAVGDYMWQYIQNVRLPFGKPLYEQFFTEYMAHKDEPNFQTEPFFLQHTDPAVVSLATDLLAERYTLSHTYEQNEHVLTGQELTSLVLQLLYELQYTVVQDMLQKLDTDRKNAEKAQDMAAFGEIFRTQQELMQVRNQLHQLLGKH